MKLILDLPFQATRSQSRSKSRTNAKSSSSSSASSSNNSQKTVFVKKFSRYQDLFCIGVEEPRDGGAIRAKREQEQEYFEGRDHS